MEGGALEVGEGVWGGVLRGGGGGVASSWEGWRISGPRCGGAAIPGGLSGWRKRSGPADCPGSGGGGGGPGAGP